MSTTQTVELTRYFSSGPKTEIIDMKTYEQWMAHIMLCGISFTAKVVPHA